MYIGHVCRESHAPLPPCTTTHKGVVNVQIEHCILSIYIDAARVCMPHQLMVPGLDVFIQGASSKVDREPSVRLINTPPIEASMPHTSPLGILLPLLNMALTSIQAIK